MDAGRPKDRARIVCVQCHDRKVKCDLQDREDNSCRNCRRLNQHCVRRTGLRKKRSRSSRQPTGMDETLTSTSSPLGQPRFTVSETTGASTIDQNEGLDPMQHHTPRVTGRSEGFISSNSVLSSAPTGTSGEEAASPEPFVAFSSCDILTGTASHILPRAPVLHALTDAFFEHVFPFYPVIDPSDVRGPHSSILLQQAVCLAGCLTWTDQDSLRLARSLYGKVKTLIFLNHESDHLAVLQALCIMSCWSAETTDTVTLDGPWQCIGSAIRLAIQMGLHKQQRHANHRRPGLLRRIFWHLVNADKIMVACWGRPSAILLKDCDVTVLSLQDFPQEGNVRSDIAMYAFQLGRITGSVIEMTSQRKTPSQEEVSNIAISLRSWHDTLPRHLRLFDQNGQRLAYDRIVSQMFIYYLVTIILSQMLLCEETCAFQPSKVSIVSSHCIATLYDEIHCRRDAQHLMQTHGFLCMAAAVPLLFSFRAAQEDERHCQESLGILCAVLTELRRKFGGSDLVLRKIHRLQLERLNTRSNTAPPRTQEGEQSTAWHKDIFEQATELLFPFPTEFCKAISMLHTSDSNPLHHDLCETFPSGVCLADYIHPAYTIMDILGLDSTTEDFWLG